MKILVANLGSTSFKYSLYEGDDSALTLLARGGYERVSDYGETIRDAISSMKKDGHIDSVDSIDAVGFKTVLGFEKTGCVAADDSVVADLRASAELAPAHNPAYANGIEQFAKEMPNAQLVALYETAFYQWASKPSRRYAVPKAWYEAGVRRNGFHGASHKFVAERSAELLGREDVAQQVRFLYQKDQSELPGKPLRVVSCHLGGSSSVTGIRNGVAIDTSMGLSPQSGLPQNNRVGDLDSMAVTYVMKKLGLSIEEVERQLTKESGLLGLSGKSNDVRDIWAAVDAGDDDAKLAIDSLVYSIRQYVGSYMLQLGGLDALVFTAGIGENDTRVRERVCQGLEDLGLELDLDKNAVTRGEETCISAANSRIKIFVIPANEELVIARETSRFLSHNK
ncbi:acetate/propionate family kinase [Pelagicoccus sp. NFK12]|uniref:Acetate kinase n=1 Tax=Pelagicoccus enzymogenes TaxID=2773457 RepID=A0A927FBG9_9BACT|nr:acetate/propionate family kinase [Pelagicoccus enzymogenes]MBD5781927.1 acetate/propionate family kinase [Pelagicoccus enzymogenes]MDQ8196685.1 acetate/propionate family kinase [Pelagicoccus enzymogenes]